MFQLTFFSQFVDPAHGRVLAQRPVLGDFMFVFAAAGIRRWFAVCPAWNVWSNCALAGVFAALAARLALDNWQ